MSFQQFSREIMKYVRPIWYFHQKPCEEIRSVWIQYSQLKPEEKDVIDYDNEYSNSILCDWDAAYQILMRGIIKDNKSDIHENEIELLPIDLYRFIRKYYKKPWLYFTFFQRILLLYNPIRELIGFYKTKDVIKINLFSKNYVYKDYSTFNSVLIHSNPLVTIIIPTYNRYELLQKVLSDLEKQNYTHFEVIIIDQSSLFREEFYNQFNPKFRIIRQNEPALWKARNRAIETSKSEYLLFLDDDSRIEADWILEHLKCIDFFNADISAGISLSLKGSKVPENYSFFRLSDQLDTGNVLIKRKVFFKCGLFDRQFEKQRMGDGEFGLRSYLNGFKSISNPLAKRIHLKSESGGLRVMGYWDSFRSNNWFAMRPAPSVLYFWRKNWGNKLAICALIQTIPFSLNPYNLKGKKSGYILSLLLFFSFFPIIIIPVICSWNKSRKMINMGPMIKRLT